MTKIIILEKDFVPGGKSWYSGRKDEKFEVYDFDKTYYSAIGKNVKDVHIANLLIPKKNCRYDTEYINILNEDEILKLFIENEKGLINYLKHFINELNINYFYLFDSVNEINYFYLDEDSALKINNNATFMHLNIQFSEDNDFYWLNKLNEDCKLEMSTKIKGKLLLKTNDFNKLSKIFKFIRINCVI